MSRTTSDIDTDTDAFRTFEAEGWEHKADPYHHFFCPITGRVVDDLLGAARVGAGTRLLDIATGPGYVAARAKERNAYVIGTDIAASMVALASERYPAIEFRQADAEALPFPDASFDAVTGNFILPHLGNAVRAVSECARVLTPGGTLALSMWDVPERNRLMGVITDAVAETAAPAPDDIPTGPPFFRYAPDDMLVELLETGGFEQVTLTHLSFGHHLTSAEELWDGLTGGTVRMAALVAGQDAAMRARIRASFDRLAAQYATVGGLDVPVAMKVVSGRKIA